MPFSKRTQWDLTETPWARRLSAMRSSGATLYDLTASNPTRCGLDYDSAATLAPLTDPQALAYDPAPRGSLAARKAVAAYYASHGVEIDPASLLLTTSTSEAYSFLFRLLCDPGDEVLIAQPSYPLFDFLAQLDDVRLVPYELIYDHGWQVDAAALRRRVTPRTRAIALVHPNNPTGHFTRSEERGALEAICREYGLALIVDEVFLDYAFSEPAPSFAAGDHPVPTFVLSGLSKVAALPQMKAAWILSFTPPSFLESQASLDASADARLEVIADTFLSVNAAVQCALPAWLDGRKTLQSQIHSRTGANLAQLDSALARQQLVTRLEVEAGWYAVLRVPALAPAEELAAAILEETSVAVHSGHFFGFPEAGWLVISLLPEEGEFSTGVANLLQFFRPFGLAP